MTWQIAMIANLVVGVAYFCIAWVIGSGLVKTGQMRTNKLGTATGLIFLTCGVGHFGMGAHMLLPSIGINDAQAFAERASWHWEAAMWDVFTAFVGIYYLSLRSSYASVLRGAQLFEDLKARERQALEINDNIVQGLTVAKYALENGRDAQTKHAVEETLQGAQRIISELLSEGEEGHVMPGDLRRKEAAGVAAGA